MAFSGDVTEITGGPAYIELSSTAIGHTQGGITATVTPSNRPRTVDEYGNSEIAIIHTGDTSRVGVPFCQWSNATWKEMYNPGLDGTTYVGLGRKAGYHYTTKQLDILPFLTADAGKYLEFAKATPIGDIVVGHALDSDRVMTIEFATLVDPAATDGKTIGQVYTPA